MRVRLLMAMAAAGVCVYLGQRAGKRLSVREDTLDAWAGAFLRMEGAVLHLGDSLPELLRRGCGERLPALCVFADRIGETPGSSAEDMLRGFAWDACLTAEERETARECLAGLFATTRDQQARALQYAQAQWRRYLRSAREIRERNGKLYRTLGWLAGAALFILIC